MTKYRVILVGIITVVMAGTAIFVACNKEGTNVSDIATKKQIGIQDGTVFSVVQITAIEKKEEPDPPQSGIPKCIDGSGSCKVRGASVNIAEDLKRWGFDIAEHGITVAIISNVSNDNGKKIRLDYKYQYNTESSLNELFNADGRYIVAEDMVENDKVLLELLNITGTNVKYIIPAGLYPVTVYEEGMTVVLPVNIVEGTVPPVTID